MFKTVSGVGVLTFLTFASVSSFSLGSSITNTTNPVFAYEGLSVFDDKEGFLSASSPKSIISFDNNADSLINNEIDYISAKKRKSVNLQIVNTRRFQSKLDFEEVFEEL